MRRFAVHIFAAPDALQRAGLSSTFERRRRSICMAEFVDGLVDSIYVTIGAALAFGVDLEPVWKLVQAANMSKGSRCSDCLGGGFDRFSEATEPPFCSSCRGTGRIVRKRVDGKVLKPHDWTPPDVGGELRRQGWGTPVTPVTADAKLERLRHAVRDAETHGFDAGSIIRLLEAAK